MATENRAVMCYLPKDLESFVSKYCEDNGLINSKGDVITPRLGTGIVRLLRLVKDGSFTSLDTVPSNEPFTSPDLVTRDDLSKEIEKAVTYLFQDLAHKSELRESVNAIAALTSQLSELKGEVDRLKESEPIE